MQESGGNELEAGTDRAQEEVKGSRLDGMWILLVPENGAKIPMLAKAGNGLYLLAFKTGFTARKFLAASQAASGVEPRMVVSSNRPEILALVAGRDVAGVLVDYDFGTHTYKEASNLN
jgi:hypothetical protein